MVGRCVVLVVVPVVAPVVPVVLVSFSCDSTGRFSLCLCAF